MESVYQAKQYIKFESINEKKNKTFIYYVKRSVEKYDLDNYKNITFLNKMT